ncbi:xylitol dehydrogenase [Leucosporidium creatinivorum]|uniref:Xylitol dehydrogenase n=1 Tax=Leucosporidium creatinivorum TaxID=106004 RepID=A0A1Y2G0K5_9BASI|nr:xylitol dehydrogenase [Leucosporidium creatinivorum]
MPIALSPTVEFESAVPSTNRAFVLHGVEDVRFEERPVPSELGSLEVIVAPKKTGLCGSDAHYLSHGSIGDYVLTSPMILGHESAGIVVKVGSAVTSLAPGDRVAMEPGESCRMCYSCKDGHYNRCPSMAFAATPPFDGTLAGFYKLPADMCYPLSHAVSLEEGALIEPLAVGVMAVTTIGQMPLGANVVVFGAGPVGLLTMAAAKALGARHVLAVDIQEPRLEFAKQYAASDYFVPTRTVEGETRLAYSRRQADEIKARFNYAERGPQGVDLIIDCTGAEICVQTALYLLKHGGTYVQVGMGTDSLTIPISTVLNKELTVKGSFRYGPGIYTQAIDLVSRGLIDLKPLITHRYAFVDAAKAFAANRAGKGEDGRALIKAVIDGPLA